MKNRIEKEYARSSGGKKDNYSNRRARRSVKTALSKNDEVVGDMKKKDWWGDRGGVDFTPLYKALVKCIGRPWNDVYSEICDKIRKESLRYEVLRYISYTVETNVRMIDGQPHTYVFRIGGGGDWLPMKRSGRWQHLYVDPEDGILKRAPEDKFIFTKKEITKYRSKDDPLVQYRKINGIWYKLSFKEVSPEERKLCRPDDLANVAQYNVYTWWDIKREFGDYILPIEKKQLNKKELKRLHKVLEERQS